MQQPLPKEKQKVCSLTPRNMGNVYRFKFRLVGLNFSS